MFGSDEPTLDIEPAPERDGDLGALIEDLEDVREELREARDERDEAGAELRERYGDPSWSSEPRETTLEEEIERARSGEGSGPSPREELENAYAEAAGRVRRLEEAEELLRKGIRAKRYETARRAVVGTVDGQYRELLGEAVAALEDAREALEVVEAFEGQFEELGYLAGKLNPPDVRATDVGGLIRPLEARREEEIPPPPEKSNGAGS